MEKGKNRTDLLAAGRKKLQQFRQRKDNKGSSGSSQQKKSKSGSLDGELVKQQDDGEVATSSGDASYDIVGCKDGLRGVISIAPDMPAVWPDTGLTGDGESGSVDLQPSDSIRESSGGTQDKMGADEEKAGVSTEGVNSDVPVGSTQGCSSSTVDQHNNSLKESLMDADHDESVGSGDLVFDGGGDRNHRHICGDGDAIEENNICLPSQISEVPQDLIKGSVHTNESQNSQDSPLLEPYSGTQPFGSENEKDTSSAALSGDAGAEGVNDNLTNVYNVTIIQERHESPGLSQYNHNVKLDTASVTLESSTGTSKAAGRPETELYAGMDHRLGSGKGDVNISAGPQIGGSQEVDAFFSPSDSPPSLEVTEAYKQDIAADSTETSGFEYKTKDFANNKNGTKSSIVSVKNNEIELQEGMSRDNMEHLKEPLLEPSDSHVTNGSHTRHDSVLDEVEYLRYHLYLTNIMKDFLSLQLDLQLECKTDFDLCCSEEVSRSQELAEKSAINCANLQRDLVDCRNQLHTVNQELRGCLASAQVEVETLSNRACESDNMLKECQEKRADLLKELKEGRRSLELLQIENGNIKSELMSEADKSKTLKNDNEHLIQENMRLASELLEQKELLASSFKNQAQLENNLKESMISIEELAEENLSLSCTLNVFQIKVKDLFEGQNFLQVENENIKSNLMSETAQNKTLKDDKEHLALENTKLASELLEQKEQLASLFNRQMQLEDDLKESMMSHDQFAEENLFLWCSLNVYKLKFEGLLDMQREHTNVFETGNPVRQRDYIVEKSVGNDSTEHFQSSESANDQEFQMVADEQADPKQPTDDNGVLCILRRHLEESESIIGIIEKTIQAMHSQNMSLISRPAGRGVSKLIKAFESKVSVDEPISDLPHVEGDQSVDSLQFSKEQTHDLRVTLSLMGNDIKKALVDFPAVWENAVHVQELEVKCATENLRNDNLEAKYEEAVKKLAHYKPLLEELESQLDVVSRNAADEIERFVIQIEVLQKAVQEATEREERIRDSVYEAVLKLDASTGLHASGSLDIIAHVNASTESAVKAIDRLHVNLEALHLDYEAKCCSNEELHKEIIRMQGKGDNVLRILQKNYNCLKQLVNGSFSDELKEDWDIRNEELLETIVENCDAQVGQLKKLLDERLQLLFLKNELQGELVSRSNCMEELKTRYIVLVNDLEVMCRFKDDLEWWLVGKNDEIEGIYNSCLVLSQKLEGYKMTSCSASISEYGIDNHLQANSVGTPLSYLEALVSSVLQRYEEATEEISLSKKYLQEIPSSEFWVDHPSIPLHIFLSREVIPKVMEAKDLQEKLEGLSSLNVQKEHEKDILKDSLSKIEEAFEANRLELHSKMTELAEAEKRYASTREKLSIAVAKGKGLIAQRESLKQSLAEKSEELEKCQQEVESKETILHELEVKLKSYSEADRIEALESELSYIRNSATAFRDSFLMKDSILQKIEEVLEDLDLPEHFHSKDTVEKVEFLARSVAGDSTVLSSDQIQSISPDESYPEAGYTVADPWKKCVQPNSTSEHDEMRIKYEELHKEYFGVEKQNNILEQSLMEKNRLVQQWEKVVDGLNIPLHLGSMGVEAKIEYLTDILSDAITRDSQQSSNTELHDLRLKLEELQNKYYDLAEQNDMLEQSLIERNRLVQHWEEVVDRIDVPPTMRSVEIEVKIEWLLRTLFEVRQERDSLLLKMEHLAERSESLAQNLEASQKKIGELDSEYSAIKHERNFLSESIDKLKHEILGASEKAVEDQLVKDQLQKERVDLKENLLEKKHHHNFLDEIKKLQDLVNDALPDSGEVHSFSSDQHIEYLENLLKRLIDNYKSLNLEKSRFEGNQQHATSQSTGMLKEQNMSDVLDDGSNVVLLKAQLDEASHDLAFVKEDRDLSSEKLHSLMLEMETMAKQVNSLLEERDAANDKYQNQLSERDSLLKERDALLEQLNQEEQRSASLKEKLNIAVRKGKGLVQQRDGLKQSIEEKNAEMEELQNELKQRMSENLSLTNQLARSDQGMLNAEQTLAGIITTLRATDIGDQARVDDPVQKIESIAKLSTDLHAAAISHEHEAKKAKRASELLLAELNEVQERCDVLQDELAKLETALAECTRQKDEAEAARSAYFSQLQNLITVHSEEKAKEFGDAVQLEAGIYEIRKQFSNISHILSSLIQDDTMYMNRMETLTKSIFRLVNGTTSSDQTVHPSSFQSTDFSHEKSAAIRTTLELKVTDQFDDSSIVDHLHLANHALHECGEELSYLKEKMTSHSSDIEQQATQITMLMDGIQSEISSQKIIAESLTREISNLKVGSNEKQTEIALLQRSLILLCEACRQSVLQIESQKAKDAGRDLASGMHLSERLSAILELSAVIDGEETANKHKFSLSEDDIGVISQSLLSAVEDFVNKEGEYFDGSQSELKSTISDLQHELYDKDIQRNRICEELASQMRAAEASTKKYLTDLESAESRIHNLEGQVKVLENDKKTLNLQVTDLKDFEASSKGLYDKVQHLTDSLKVKDQEIEGLMQALDEEESQLETLENRNLVLEELVQEKTLALESLEASRAKSMAKLSATVNKFDELHHLSESLLTEVENLQSQLQERDSEISFLRQEVTRCTKDALAGQDTNKKFSTEIAQFKKGMEMLISRTRVNNISLNDENISDVLESEDPIPKQFSSVIAKLVELQIAVKNKDVSLQIERDRVEENLRKVKNLETSLSEKDSEIILLQQVRGSGQPSTTNSMEPLEIEPVRSKGAGLSYVAPHVRNARRANIDQASVSIDLEQGNEMQDEEDDDKAHGFKSLTMSRFIPRATRPVTDRIDGLWVSIERLLMRQPTLRLGLILYWIALHALLASSI